MTARGSNAVAALLLVAAVHVAAAEDAVLNLRAKVVPAATGGWPSHFGKGCRPDDGRRQAGRSAQHPRDTPP